MTENLKTYTSNPTAQNTARLTTDELTNFLNEEQYARTLGNIARRAGNLWVDGYIMFKSFVPGLRYVVSPKDDEYAVNIGTAMPEGCDCPAFGKYGTCKHYLAVSWEMRQEAEAAEFDRLMAIGETSTGCDPYPEF